MTKKNKNFQLFTILAVFCYFKLCKDDLEKETRYLIIGKEADTSLNGEYQINDVRPITKVKKNVNKLLKLRTIVR